MSRFGIRRLALRYRRSVLNSVEVYAEQIDDAYRSLGHQLGWRFLYSAAATLRPDASLILAGLNPGGSFYSPPEPSSESGNAYRIERWADDGRGLNTLQKQIALLFAGLGTRLGVSGGALLDQTLSANFCPFRSPSWEALHRPQESIAFSSGLWRQILAHVRPHVIICLGAESGRQKSLILGGPIAPPLRVPIGWGSYTYSEVRFASRDDDEILLIQLPHLSRFGFIGRAASTSATHRLCDAVAARLTP